MEDRAAYIHSKHNSPMSWRTKKEVEWFEPQHFVFEGSQGIPTLNKMLSQSVKLQKRGIKQQPFIEIFHTWAESHTEAGACLPFCQETSHLEIKVPAWRNFFAICVRF